MRQIKTLSTSVAAITLALSSVPAVAAGLPVGSCINAGNHLDWGDENSPDRKVLEESDFRNMRAAGFQTVRITANWFTHSASTPPHAVDKIWMTRVSKVVDQALGAGLNVILDSHNFELVHKDPEAASPWLAAVWEQIGRNFADRPVGHLWFEIENEPHDKLTNANLMQTLNPALAAIRRSNPDRPVIIGGDGWSSVDSLATLELPADPNVYPTFHYYEPFDFTHQGASWVAPNIPPLGRKYGSAADHARLAVDVKKVQSYIARTGRIPFMGENGAYESAPLDQRIAYHQAVSNAFQPTGIGRCVWAYTNTFPFYDHKKGEWTPGLLGAIGLKEQSYNTAIPAAPNQIVANPAAPISAGPPRDPEIEALDAKLPGRLINDPRQLLGLNLSGVKAANKVVKSDKIPGGGAALQVKIDKAPDQAWKITASMNLAEAIKKDEVVTVGFYARALPGADGVANGRASVRIQQNSEPWPGFIDRMVDIGPDWKWYEASGTATTSIANGNGSVILQLGGQSQTVEIGQVIVVKGATAIVTAEVATPTETLPPQLANLGVLVNNPDAGPWGFYGSGGSQKPIADKGVFTGKATRITIAEKGGGAWEVASAIPLNVAINEGDSYVVAIAIRTVSAETADGKGVVNIRFQSNQPPFDGFADNMINPGPNWQLIRLRTTAKKAIPAGQAVFSLLFAGAKQVIDVGPVYIIKTN